MHDRSVILALSEKSTQCWHKTTIPPLFTVDILFIYISTMSVVQFEDLFFLSKATFVDFPAFTTVELSALT